MATNLQGGGMTLDTFTPDSLLISPGSERLEEVVLKENDSAAGEYVRGALLVKRSDGKYDPVAAAETVVALNATGEVLSDNLQAASGTAAIPFALAHPPIPGTVTLATTANASATPVLALGTDNGGGYGSGAGGSFTIDYATGHGVAYPNAAAVNGYDLKAGYTYHGGSTGGLPDCILAEDVTNAMMANDYTTVAYVEGVFNEDAIQGYSAGYKEHLRMLNIRVESAV